MMALMGTHALVLQASLGHSVKQVSNVSECGTCKDAVNGYTCTSLEYSIKQVTVAKLGAEKGGGHKFFSRKGKSKKKKVTAGR